MSGKDQAKFNRLQNTRALIIGGSSGLGYGAAEALIESGAIHITISSSNQTRIDTAVKQLKASYPSRASSITIDGQACDLGNQDTLEDNVASILKFASKGGKLDHVIHSAGDALAVIPISEATIPRTIQAATVRYLSAVMLAKHAPAYMNPGPQSSITLTTGAVSERPIPQWSIPGGFATGICGLVRGFALDLKPIRVNAISPGFVETALWDALKAQDGGQTYNALRESAKEKSCTGRVATADDVAEAYLYVMKDWNTTGEIISTSGGHLLI